MKPNNFFMELKKELTEVLGLDGVHKQRFPLIYYPKIYNFYCMLLSEEELKTLEEKGNIYGKD